MFPDCRSLSGEVEHIYLYKTRGNQKSGALTYPTYINYFIAVINPVPSTVNSYLNVSIT